MGKALLIGDSGGTGTDWCLVGSDGAREYFSGESYHPSRFSGEFFETMRLFWEGKGIDPATEVYLYGAGCSMKHNQEVLENHFKALGFRQVFVESDLLGTCRGLLGDTAGLVGILGTGSVLAEYDGAAITAIHGGFGYLIGDEGSGYSFGKKLAHGYLNGRFSPELTARISAEIGDRAAVMQAVYGADGKQWISKLASRWSSEAELEALTIENISAFVELYLLKKNFNNQTICFSGSYASHNSKILTDILGEKGWEVTQIVQKPIALITDYTIKGTL